MRKKFFLFAIMMACNVSSAFAQMSSNVNHLNFAVGALYERGLDATLSYEHETRYHHAWEYFLNGYIKWADDPDAGHVTRQSFWHNYFTYNIGIAYKPCVVRGRNHHGNLRIGISGGSDTEKIIGAAHLGYEHTYALRNGVKEDVVLRGEDLFRTGVALGVKLPL